MKTLRQTITNLRPHFSKKRLQKSRYFVRTRTAILRHPLMAFLGLLGVIFLLILAGFILEQKQREDAKRPELTKQVRVFSIGESPKVSMQARVEKSGVVQVIAQSAGIVQEIHVRAGESVTKGKPIVTLSTNAAGQDASALQAAIAGTQYRLASKSYIIQQDIIQKQREIAERTDENTEELRLISEESLEDTRGVLDENRQIVETINVNLELLVTTNEDGSNDELILQARQLRSQYSGAIAQLQNQVRTLEYQTDEENPPTELARLQKDVTLRQLDLQEKSLKLQKEIAGLQSSLAQVTASLMKPASPFDGVVERIHVQIGQSVNPGTLIATVTGNSQSAEAIVLVPESFIQTVNRLEPALFHLNGSEVSIFPHYLSTNATSGLLYSVQYLLPEESVHMVTNQSYIAVEIPLGTLATSGTLPYLPIDSVYQTQNESYVFVVDNGRAQSRKVTLGAVYGRYVEILTGINTGDQIILDRNVLDGDLVTFVGN